MKVRSVPTPLSPLLMNVALHGLETAITTAFPATKGGRRWQPQVIRYADDLVVFHRDYDAIVQVQDIASRWLQEMGLTLKPSKTRIGHTLHPVDGMAGFDFLSFQVRQYPVGQTKTGKTGQGKPLGFKTLIRPSKAGQRRRLHQMHKEVRRLRGASQEVLIKRSIPSSKDGATTMPRWLLKRPSSAWIRSSTPTCVDGHSAVIRRNRHGGSARSTGTQAKVNGASKRPTRSSWPNIAPPRSVGIRKWRAGVARMTVIGSTGQADWADIRNSHPSGLSCSNGKAEAARGVDCTLNMERT